jgi:hypothetical protein
MGGDALRLMEGKHLRLAFFDLAIFIAACEGEEFIIEIVSHIGTVAVAVVNEVEGCVILIAVLAVAAIAPGSEVEIERSKRWSMEGEILG